MTVPINKLVSMAEQVGRNISVSEDQDVVATELAAHLKRFWDPRMLAAFVSGAEQEGPLSPVVAAALKKLAA